MDESAQIKEPEQPENQKLVDELRKGQELNRGSLAHTNPNPLHEILKQRKEQRDKLLSTIIHLIWSSFFLLAGLLYLQTIARLLISPTFTIVDDAVYNTLAISVFGQVIGVIVTISLSLWNDKMYIDSMKNL